MKKEFFNTTPVNLLLTVVFGIVISYIDLHNDEVQPAVLLLFLFSFIMGYKHSRNAWLYSLMLGLSVISGYLFAKITGFIPKGPPPSNILWSLLALVPSFMGGYTGVAFRHIFKRQRRKFVQ